MNLQYAVMQLSETLGITDEMKRRNISLSISAHYGVTMNDLYSKTRKREVVMARQLSMYLIRKYTAYSLVQIGDYFGGRDHSTVIHSIDIIEGLPPHDTQYLDKLKFISKFAHYKTN
jgi:chromosomal replication initiator protein